MTNYDVEHTIKKEMSGDVRDVFVAIGNWWGPRERAGGHREHGQIHWMSVASIVS